MTYAEQLMHQRGLERCPPCPGLFPVIGSDGPITARALFIGEKPGKEENSRGRCFVGTNSKEFNQHYLPLSGLTRDEVRLANCMRCFSREDSDSPRLQAIKIACAEFHLKREILAGQPEVIVTMGAVASSLVKGINLEMHHGIQQKNVDWWGHKCDVFPIFHPAASMHKTDLILPLRMDFIELGKVLRGQGTPRPIDEYPDPVYEILETKADVVSVLDCYPGLDNECAVDTETDPEEGFWCLTFSLEAGTGFMIRRVNAAGLAVFRDWILDTKGIVAFHNGMYDLPVLMEVGIHVPSSRFDDTMIRAYHLQNLPQALKILAYRLCGMEMEEFEDVVTPYGMDVMVSYLLNLAGVDWPKPEKQLILDPQGNYKVYTPQGLNKKVNRLIGDLIKNPQHKLFKRWDEWSDEEKLPALQMFGDMPKPSIKYVPLAKAGRYAMRDADATFRVRQKLKSLKRSIRKPYVN